MSRRWRERLAWASVAVTLAVVNVAILRKERVLARGTTVLLELGSRDPRSLMQGDYMQLNYQLNWQIDAAPVSYERKDDGRVVVDLAADGVAHFARMAGPREILGPNQHLLRYRRRGGTIRVGPGAFFFEEGTADRFSRAAFGELRVDADGDAVLVGLRDVNRQPLGR